MVMSTTEQLPADVAGCAGRCWAECRACLRRIAPTGPGRYVMMDPPKGRGFCKYRVPVETDGEIVRDAIRMLSDSKHRISDEELAADRAEHEGQWIPR